MQNQDINEKPPVSGLAITSLMCAISTLFVGPVATIPAIICGHIARRNDKTQTLALAGEVISYVILLAMVAIMILASFNLA